MRPRIEKHFYPATHSLMGCRRALACDLIGFIQGKSETGETEKYFSAFPEAPEVNDIIAYEREKLLGRRLCERVREAVGLDYASIAKLNAD